jgi:methionine synthase II (cobalamin-independent)
MPPTSSSIRSSSPTASARHWRTSRERLIPAPDCGMKYIPRGTAFAKLKAMAQGAAIVRRELTAS